MTQRFMYGAKPHVRDYMIKSGKQYTIISDAIGSACLVVNSTTGFAARYGMRSSWILPRPMLPLWLQHPLVHVHKREFATDRDQADARLQPLDYRQEPVAVVLPLEQLNLCSVLSNQHVGL